MKPSTAIVIGALLASIVCASSALAGAGDDAILASASNERVPGARALEGRLIAPCCWTQTLDIHDSPIAQELRAEISKRLKAGETSAKIEDDLAIRYGEKIRAVPRGEDPRVALPVIVGGSMALAVVWMAWIGAAWLRRSRARGRPSETTVSASGKEHYDAQLDDELEHLSDVT